MQWSPSTWILIAVAGSAFACNKSKPDAQPTAASASVVVNALSRQTSPYAKNRKKYVPQAMPSRLPIPGGPSLAILAGKGVGPIRFGATVKTIERHMQSPCEIKTETLCRFIARAIDFQIKDEVLDRVVVHRMGRPAGKDNTGEERTFGVFNGGLPPDFQLMMKQEVIAEHLGKPLRKETVKTPGPFNTIERDYYDGLIVEYDRFDNGSMVLGGVIVEKPSASTAASGAVSATPSAAQPKKDK